MVTWVQGKDGRMIVFVLPVVNVYKYLDVLFCTKVSFTASFYDLTSKAKNAVLCIMEKL